MKKVERIIIIEGPDDWVDKTLKNSMLQPNMPWIFSETKSIVETFRTILENVKDINTIHAKENISIDVNNSDIQFIP